MGKKREREAHDGADHRSPKRTAGEADSDGEDFDMVDVNFEWFNFDSNIDYRGVKNLLRQLFDIDNTHMNLEQLSDLIIAQNTIGSAVKVDTKENDPYAFLTVLNLKEHKENEHVASLVQYLSRKATETEALAPIPNVIQNAHVGVLLSERLINMPAQITPPLYSMLVEELDDAVEDKEPYDFSHILIVSKTYHEVEPSIGNEGQKKKTSDSPMFYFHPEDEVLLKHAMAYGSYSYTNEGNSASADSKRAFQEAGISPQGFMMLIEAKSFREAVKAVGEYMGSGDV